MVGQGLVGMAWSCASGSLYIGMNEAVGCWELMRMICVVAIGTTEVMTISAHMQIGFGSKSVVSVVKSETEIHLAVFLAAAPTGTIEQVR